MWCACGVVGVYVVCVCACVCMWCVCVMGVYVVCVIVRVCVCVCVCVCALGVKPMSDDKCVCVSVVTTVCSVVGCFWPEYEVSMPRAHLGKGALRPDYHDYYHNRL